MKKNIFSKVLIFLALFFMIINISACTKVYTISFDTDGAVPIENIQVKKGELIPAPIEPTKEGYKFVGWYFQGEEWKIETDIVEGDMNLIANWIANKYSIIFDTDGGSQIDEIKLDYDEIIVIPSNPIKEGYTFVGWDKEVPDKMPANDLELKAIWTINQYTITFDTKGGSEIAAITQDYNTSIISPSAPTKEGYEFVGWDQEIPDKMPGENIVLNAIWTISQYTINFDTDGGSKIDAITQDYHTAIVSPSAPTKDGYVFVGWDQEIPTIMPAKNMTIKALWAANKYSIIFDTDGGNLIPTIIQDCNTSVSVPSNPTKLGYTFAGWDQEIPTIMPAKNMTIKALWVINIYTITFDSDGGSGISSITQDYNTDIVAPQNPTKVGYTFTGWDQEVPTKMPANDLKLKAIWTINKYTITFDTDGGSEITDITQDYNTDIVAPQNPTKVGYTFTGWDKEVPEVMPANDLELKATWEVNQYKITFDLDGGEGVEELTFDYNEEIVISENPTKLGYTFTGWDQEVPETMPANDLELKATWEVNQYTITFDLDGGEGVEELTFDYNEEIVIPENPTKSGFVFVGWDQEIPETMPAENITISAIWTTDPKEVSFDTQTDETLDSIVVADGQLIEQPEDLTKEGYSFDGWYLGEEKWNFEEDVVTENITLVAKWIINQYEIVFNLDGGEGVEELTFDYNEEIVISENPTKPGYTFTGWDKEVPEVMPANDLELKAVWKVNQYTIIFDTDGGSEIAPITQDYNTPILAPDNPTKEYCIFVGWDKKVPETMPAENITLKAIWEGVSFTITFDLDGGEGVEELTFAYNEKIVIPEKPSKSGYYFVGWDKEVPETMPAENITLKAIWSNSLITINYDNNGGYVTGYTDFTDITDIRTQLLNDYNSFTGGSYTLDTIGTLSIWGYTNFHTMLQANDNELLNKYMPLLIWISMNGSGSATANNNKSAFTKLINGSALGSDNDIYSISYELRAFMGGTVIRANNPFGTTDYTSDVFSDIWAYITEEYQAPKVTIKYVNNENLLLPIREGYKFVGWYNENNELVEELPFGLDETIFNLKAEWEKIGATYYTVTYNLDGGQWNGALPQTKFEDGYPFTLPTPIKEDYNFMGWYDSNDNKVETLGNQNYELTAKWLEKSIIYYSIEYVLDGGEFTTTAPEQVLVDSELIIPVPLKEGYTFLGWKLYSNADEIFITVENQNTDMKLYAVWGNEGIYVGKDLDYETLAEAITVANNGDTIVLMPGTYEGAKINKSLTIKGYNALNNLSTKESKQVIFTSDLIIAADNVTINGVVATDSTKFTNTTSMNIANPTIKNSIVRDSTVNSTTSDNTTAPFYFTNTNGYSITNLVIDNCIIENKTGGRPMIAWLSQVDGLTIKNSQFLGGTVKSNYNDGIKTNNATEYGVKGNVTITGNHFENYYQYVLWLRSYGAGTYTLENNTFTTVGQTAGTHAAFTFGSFAGSESEKVNISIKYNTVTSSYMLAKFGAASALSDTNATISANYNKMINCSGIYMTNSTEVTINVENNYWGTSAISAESFTGVALPTAYYTSADDVPSKGEVEDTTYTITYELGGGTWAYEEYTYDEIVSDLLVDLNLYYGKTNLTASNLHSETYGASVTMYDFFKSNTTYSPKWEWLIPYILETRQNDSAHSSGYEDLVNNVDTIWRFEISAFVSKSAIDAWPYSSDYSLIQVQENLKKYSVAMNVYEEPITTYKEGIGASLIEPIYPGHIFLYWLSDNNQVFTSNIPTNVSGNLKLTAVYEDEIQVEEVTFTNIVDTILATDIVQLEWSITPANATNQTITFSSSDSNIFTVSNTGLITPVAIGTATLNVFVEGNSSLNCTYEINIVAPSQFVFTYETNSYTEIGESIKINNYYLKEGVKVTDLNWESMNPSVATVNNGVVTGVSAGTATIRSSLKADSSKYVDFTITVLPESLSNIMQVIVNSHNSNLFTRYQLGIGSGTPAYYLDMIGSVSDLLYNNPLKIDTKYLANGNAAGNYFENSLIDNGLHFVTVHYTAGFPASSDTDNNASYFTSSGAGVSIHYVTGNPGKYSDGSVSSDVYQTLSHEHGAWHAGDSGALSASGAFEWKATGVVYDGCDLLDVEFSASNDFYFEINGKKTSVPLPTTWNYNSRNTNHIYNSDGTISAQTGFSNWGSTFSNRSPESFFNDQGFPIKVENGEYYMGTTWWCYTQVYEGRICGSGGNRNSIGIEACVNQGSDIWLTYQKTAQLVGKLLYDNNLDLSRVKGHHFFAAKDCPQPLLENNMEIWKEFIEQVRYEHQLLNLNSDSRYTITMQKVSNGDCISSYGRLTNQPAFSTVITYKVIITDTQTNTTEEITLSSVIEGTYLNK